MWLEGGRERRRCHPFLDRSRAILGTFGKRSRSVRCSWIAREEKNEERRERETESPSRANQLRVQRMRRRVKRLPPSQPGKEVESDLNEEDRDPEESHLTSLRLSQTKKKRGRASL